MEAVLEVEAPVEGELAAVEVRERLVGFVEEVTRGLPHPRQRENAGVYLRGLVEHGGRKSLQPTLFRLGEDAACYESMQQFLADSPWDPALLVRACAERVSLRSPEERFAVPARASAIHIRKHVALGGLINRIRSRRMTP